MATLPSADLDRIHRGLMRYWSRSSTSLSLTKDELLSAVTSTDTWIDNNQASFNSSLPAAAQTSLSAEQKTLLFCAVALMRVGLVSLKTLFGEVD